jgi:hypothetical protein
MRQVFGCARRERPRRFLQGIASSLQNCAEIGPGAVYRAIATAQRHFFDPPNLEGENGRRRHAAKYG